MEYSSYKTQGLVARLKGEGSNLLFEELADWNEQLSHCDYYKDGDEPAEERRPKRPNNRSYNPKNGGLS